MSRLIPESVIDPHPSEGRGLTVARYPYVRSLVASLPDAEYHRFICGLGWHIFIERTEFDAQSELDHDREIGEQIIATFRYELDCNPKQLPEMALTSKERKPGPLNGELEAIC